MKTVKPVLKRQTVMLDEAAITKAQTIAEGNISRGIRVALKAYPKPKQSKDQK